MLACLADDAGGHSDTDRTANLCPPLRRRRRGVVVRGLAGDLSAVDFLQPHGQAVCADLVIGTGCAGGIPALRGTRPAPLAARNGVRGKHSRLRLAALDQPAIRRGAVPRIRAACVCQA